MEKIVVKGGQRLTGRVKVEGAKNAVLPIQAASILASSGNIKLSNVPILSDVTTMNQIKIGKFIAECRKKHNLTQM